MLSTTKNKTVVGLDVEAGSVAATEVASNGDSAVAKFGMAPLGAGVFSEGEVSDPEALGDALKELFSTNKLSKTVRVGLASQRVAVRTLRLPLIEDHGELETAIRFQAQDHIPMPLEQAVLDWQVVGQSTGQNGERQVDVVAVAARRDMLAGLMGALTRAGLRPIGVDLSAFGMIRALARESYTPVDPGDYVDAPSPARRPDQQRSASPSQKRSGLRRARRPRAVHPRGCTATLATSPTLLWPATRPVCSLASRRSAWRGSPRSSPSGDSSPWSTRASGSFTWAWINRSRGSRATCRRSPPHATRSPRAPHGSSTSFACRSSTTRRRRARYRSRVSSPAVREQPFPVSRERLQRDLGQRFEVGSPRALAHLDAPTAARLTLSFGLALEE